MSKPIGGRYCFVKLKGHWEYASQTDEQAKAGVCLLLQQNQTVSMKDIESVIEILKTP